MFVSFSYTECVAPGPFKKESGFKFKSVVQNNLGVEPLPSLGPEVQVILDKASGAFLPYRAPEIDPFMKREQFNALEKQWSLQRLDDSHTMFTRMFTSGVSNGRPGNPFHQGFVFSKSETLAVVRSTADLADLHFARPADFYDWADWLGPKGDAELEASELEEDNPPLPSLDNESWGVRVNSLVSSQPQRTLALLAEFEACLRDVGVCKVVSNGTDDFFTQVSLLTHLLPLQPSWRFEYSTVPASLAKTPALEMSDSNPSSPAAPGPWSELAFEVLSSGQIVNIDRALGQLTSVLNFSEDKPMSWLTALPLAVAITPAESLDRELGTKLANQADALLKGLPVPVSWNSAQESEVLLDRLSSPSQLLRQFSRSEAVYRKLSELPVAV
jgi:hypothetical protein